MPELSDVGPFAMAFTVALVVDWAWARYIMTTAEKKAVQASALSAFIVLLGGTNTLLLMQDKRTILAAAIGGGIGTYFTVREARRKEEAKTKSTHIDPSGD